MPLDQPCRMRREAEWPGVNHVGAWRISQRCSEGDGLAGRGHNSGPADIIHRERPVLITQNCQRASARWTRASPLGGSIFCPALKCVSPLVAACSNAEMVPAWARGQDIRPRAVIPGFPRR
jgi:hypothetical protein